MDTHLFRCACSARVVSRASLSRTMFQRKVAGISPKEQFRLQAIVDGELSCGECQKEGVTPASSREVWALLDELGRMKSTFGCGEIKRPVPGSRRHYWSGIQRAILEGELNESSRAPRPEHFRNGMRKKKGATCFQVAPYP